MNLKIELKLNSAMLKRILFYSTLVLVVSCSSNAPLQVLPILGKHTYAANEVPKHIEGYYYLENFKDTRDSIARMFSILENELAPKYRKKNRFKAIILDNKDEVYIDDGVAIVDEDCLHYFFIIMDSLQNYKEMLVLNEVYKDVYDFKKNNEKSYTIANKGHQFKIKMAYKDITIETLQHFLNIVAYERRQTKDQLGQYSYQLQHKESQAIDCEIIYYNDPEKGLDNVFKIRFP